MHTLENIKYISQQVQMTCIEEHHLLNIVQNYGFLPET